MKTIEKYLSNRRRIPAAISVLLAGTALSASAATLVSRYSFTEASGTNAADSVGGYTAHLNGGCSFDGAGKVVLNGTNSYVSLPPAQLSGVTAITLDAWFSFTVPNNNVHLFSIDDGGGTGSGGSYLRYNVFDSGNGNGGTNFFEGIVSWGGNVLHGGSALPTNNTQVHVTLVYDPDNGVKSIYLNGALSSTYSGSLSALSSYPQTAFNLGRSPWASYGDAYLKGQINEFRVYAGVLSAAEIQVNETAGPDIIPQITIGLPQASPTNTVYAGETVTLSCGVSGPVTGYNWEWDSGSSGASFTRISGANGLTYSPSTAAMLGSYQYRFVATNSSSSATSSVVTLTVNAATAPVVTTDITPNPVTRYTGESVTFSAAFDGNHPISYQWQVDKGTGFTNISLATNASLTLSSLVLGDAGNYRLSAANSVGGGVSSASTLTVNDVSLAKFKWQKPVAFNGLNADQILTNLAGNYAAAAAFGGASYDVTLGNGRIYTFSSDGSVASVSGQGTGSGAYPAATGLSTSNANFNAVLNRYSWDGGPKTLYLNNLVSGETYSVQLFALDDRSLGGGESNRLCNFQDPNDEADISDTFKMGDNVYVVGTFVASSSTETIQVNLPTGNAGSMNALVLRALSFTPANQPPTITVSPQSQTAFSGHPVSFTVTANSYVIPTYQWQAGPAGGPYTNLVSGGVVSNAAAATLYVTNATAFAGAEFEVVVSNPAGSAVSGTAALTVNPVPPASDKGGAAILAKSPVAYWHLNETADPSAGGVGVCDSAGTHDGAYGTAAQNAYNGVAGVTRMDGFPLFGTNSGALRSTVNTDQSWVTTPALNLNTNTVTISMWIYPDGAQTGPAGLYVNRNSGTVAGLGYYTSDRLGYKWNNDGSSTWGFNSGLLIPPSTWSFVAMVVEPDRATLYLYNTNGMSTATNFTTHTNMSWGGSSANIRIGCDNSTATAFNGIIDEVAVFNRALSYTEVTQVAQMAPAASIQVSGTKLQVSWPYGTLLEAPAVTGPWTTNVNTSPYLFTPTASQKFYRVQLP
jgi:hypothetical protein